MSRWHDITHKEYKPGDVVLREFDCKKCGKHVVVVDVRDKRSVYCCYSCERQYWRDATKRGGAGKQGNGLSGGMSLGSLIRREKMSLG